MIFNVSFTKSKSDQILELDGLIKSNDQFNSFKIKENYIWTTMKGLDKFALPKANYKMLELLNKDI